MTNDPSTWSTIVDLINSIGVVGLLGLALVGLQRGWWAPGRQYVQLMERNEKLEELVNKTNVETRDTLLEVQRKFDESRHELAKLTAENSVLRKAQEARS